MSLPKLVTRINWVNDTDPAINDTHLNQMDTELDNIDDRVIAMEGDVEAQAENAEAWAVGERGGNPVDPTDPTYENNSKHYAGEASDSATAASTSAGAAADSAEDAEAWAVGERGGNPVDPTDPTYENNSKHYAQQSASSAGESADSAEDAEALANGTRGGVPIGPSDPAYENNAKYWRDQAHSIVGDKVDSFNGRTGVVLPQSGDYALAQLSDVNITSPQDGDTLVYDSATQKWTNVAVTPPAVTVTLTLNGAKNDVITVKDSNDQTVGTCSFAAGQTSGTVQIDVPAGGGNFKFVSAVAKGITEETKNDDYEKTVALSDAVSQTVNVYPKKALYWYGNKVNVTTFWGNNSDNIQRNTTPPDGSITENTNNIVCKGGVRRRGICSLTTATGTTLKAFVTTSNVVGDGTVKLSENANDTTLTTRVDIASINTPQTDYIVSGSITSGNYALLSQYNVDLTIKALWCDDGHEDDITIHGAKEDIITIKDSDDQTVATCIFGSGQTVGYVSKALLTSGTYKFISSVAKDTAAGTSDYEKTITLDGSETEISVMPDKVIYWYGNEVVAMTAVGMAVDSGGTATVPTVTSNTNSKLIENTRGTGDFSGIYYAPYDLTGVADVKIKCSSIAGDYTYAQATIRTLSAITGYINDVSINTDWFVRRSQGITTFNGIKTLSNTATGNKYIAITMSDQNTTNLTSVTMNALWLE